MHTNNCPFAIHFVWQFHQYSVKMDVERTIISRSRPHRRESRSRIIFPGASMMRSKLSLSRDSTGLWSKEDQEIVRPIWYSKKVREKAFTRAIKRPAKWADLWSFPAVIDIIISIINIIIIRRPSRSIRCNEKYREESYWKDFNILYCKKDSFLYWMFDIWNLQHPYEKCRFQRKEKNNSLSRKHNYF